MQLHGGDNFEHGGVWGHPVLAAGFPWPARVLHNRAGARTVQAGWTNEAGKDASSSQVAATDGSLGATGLSFYQHH